MLPIVGLCALCQYALTPPPSQARMESIHAASKTLRISASLARDRVRSRSIAPRSFTTCSSEIGSARTFEHRDSMLSDLAQLASSADSSLQSQLSQQACQLDEAYVQMVYNLVKVSALPYLH